MKARNACLQYMSNQCWDLCVNSVLNDASSNNSLVADLVLMLCNSLVPRFNPACLLGEIGQAHSNGPKTDKSEKLRLWGGR
jgi:hypothetical protein